MISKSFSWYVSCILSLLISQSIWAQDTFWMPTNGPYGASIHAVAVSENGDVFAGGPGGLFRSTNGGITWMQISEEQVTEIFATSSGALIRAGAQYPMRSSDNGQTWTELNIDFGFSCCPTIQAFGESGEFLYTSFDSYGFFRSADNGDTWTDIGFDEDAVTSLAIDTNGNVFALTEERVLFFSGDNGDSWSSIDLPPETLGYLLAINTSNHLFITVGERRGNNIACAGVLRSTDAGTTWTDINHGPLAFPRQCFDHIYIHPNGTLLLNAAITLYRSTNNGDSWSEINGIEGNIGIEDLATNSNSTILAGTVLGVYRSSDSGLSWFFSVEGMLGTWIYDLVIKNNHIFAATAGHGVHRSTDEGAHWVPINNGLMDHYIYSLLVTPNGHIFAGTDAKGIFRSTDDGASWTRVRMLNAPVREMIERADGTLFAAVRGEGILHSQDQGASWTSSSSSGIFNTLIALTSTPNGYLFAGTGNGVYRSVDNGETWTWVNAGLTDPRVRSLASTTNGYLFAGMEVGIFRSMDYGETWESTGIGNNGGNSIVINEQEHLFVGAGSQGVFRSMDYGDTWVQVGEGLPEVTFVQSMVFDADEYLYAGTSFRGVYRSVESTQVSVQNVMEKIPEQTKLGTNYPNPFNSVTTITFDLPHPNSVALKVYDMLGREVVVLASGHFAAGRFEATWDASRLVSGLYLYRLQVGAYTETRKMLLLK